MGRKGEAGKGKYAVERALRKKTHKKKQRDEGIRWTDKKGT